MYARIIRTAFLFLMCSGCLASAASAHGPGVLGSGRSEECAAELTAVFGPHTAFSAVAHFTEKDRAASAARMKEMVYYPPRRQIADRDGCCQELRVLA